MCGLSRPARETPFRNCVVVNPTDVLDFVIDNVKYNRE